MSTQLRPGVTPGPAGVDFLFVNPSNGQITTHGGVASGLLAGGLSVHNLRPWIGQDGQAYVTTQQQGELAARLVAHATLRKDEWKHYDTAVVKAARIRLGGVSDLVSRGLHHVISNGLAKTVLEYEDVSDMSDAEVSMDGVTRSDGDRVEFNIKYLPLPIIHKSFYLSARVLEASRTTGEPLDTTGAEQAARRVAEKSEALLFNGSASYTFGGGTLYGYTDAPDRNTQTLSVNWDDAAKTGAQIVTEVRQMKQKALNARHYGPFGLYVPTAYETVLDDNFVSSYPGTIRERILAIEGIQFVKVSDKLTANNVVLVELMPETARIVEGLPIQTVEWQSQGGMLFHYKVMSILVPQIRADVDGNSGIVHLA